MYQKEQDMRPLIISICCLLLPLFGCESSVNTSLITLSEPAMSEQVDSKTMAPVAPVDLFPPTVMTLNATVKLSNAPSNTTVTARFYFGEQGKKEIARDVITTSGTGYLRFSLNPPESGWSLGTYQVKFYLGEEMKESLTFFIKSQLPIAAEATSSEGSAAPLTGREDKKYKVFNDKQFGFSLELPSNWNSRVIGKNKDYLFTGPKESKEGEIVVIVQMIDTRQPPQSNLKDEMSNQYNMISQRDGAKIVKKSDIKIAGIIAPYFLATYPADNHQKKTVIWGHTQLGLQNGPIILLISYAAPREIYQRNVDTFQHMMDSTLLSSPDP
jgi:hypothetical protein